MSSSIPVIKTLSKQNLIGLVSTKDVSVKFLKQNEKDHTPHPHPHPQEHDEVNIQEEEDDVLN